MIFGKSSQERIGVLTEDRGKLSIAILKLNVLEDKIGRLKKDPYGLDAGFLSSFVKAWAEASAHQVAATYGRGCDVRRLEALAQEREEYAREYDSEPQTVSVLLRKAFNLAEAHAFREAAEFWKG